MKKYLAIIAALVCSVSCLTGQYKYSYQIAINFETSSTDEEIFGINDVFNTTGFSFDAIYFNSCRDTLEDKSVVFTGGFAYAYKTDSLLIEAGTPIPASLRYTAFDSKSNETLKNHFALYIQNKDPEKNPEQALIFTNASLGTSTCSLSSVYVTNTALAVNKANGLVEGCEPLADTDYAKVVLTPYNSNVKSTPVEISLLSEGKVISAWTEVDISAIADFDYIQIAITTSRPDIFDTVAIDALSGKANIEY